MNSLSYFRSGKVISLKEVDSDVETKQYNRDTRRLTKFKRLKRSKREGKDTEAAGGDKEEGSKPQFVKRRQNSRRRGDGDNSFPSGEV